ncbi:sialin isoform X2 [Procambarus clarkii]|uniref:sialin isoform X2 n=1 Tax=Procambarus clarkii TaxID=6728 RepID=UPI0037429CBF
MNEVDGLEEWSAGGPHIITTPNTRIWRWFRAGLPLRYVVVVLGLLGCCMDYLVRGGLNIAIVAMVNTTRSTLNDSHLPSGACPATRNLSHNGTDDDDLGGGEFDWSLEEQGIILGTFFWGYFFTKTSGGRLSEILGGREMMAISLGASGMLSLLCPYAAYLHPMALASLRFIMGLVQGPAFPALYSVLASWSPPDELATMVTIAYSGMSLGSLVAIGTSGWVVHQLGWQWVFWGGGTLALVWTPFWLYFVRNSPINHPLISAEEEELLGVNYSIKPRRNVPWTHLIRCYRFYPCILAEFATSWVGNQTITEGPTFLKMQIGMSLTEVSWVLAGGQTCSWIGSFTFGRLSDLLIHHNIFSKVNTRRLMHFIGMMLVVVGLCCMVWAGCHKWVVSALLVFVMIGTSTTLSTFTLAPMDLAPNYAGTLSGLLGIGNISGFVAPIATAEIITKTGGWTGSLLLGSGLYLLTGFIYMATVTTEVQDWNYYEDLHSLIEDQQP